MGQTVSRRQASQGDQQQWQQQGGGEGISQGAGWNQHCFKKLFSPQKQHAARAATQQERAWVTGLTAANLVVAALGQGSPAEILPGAPGACMH